MALDFHTKVNVRLTTINNTDPALSTRLKKKDNVFSLGLGPQQPQCTTERGGPIVPHVPLTVH